MRSVNFSSDNLAVQWQYVKRNLGELGVLYQFDDFEFQARGVIQRLIQDCVNEEFALQIRAQRYEHAPNRLDERQGGYERNLTTTFGTSRIRIPRVRFNKVKVHYSLFEKYQRRQKKFDRMVLLSMLLGHSVRKQRRFFRAFLGDAVSHTTASRLIKSLEGDLQHFRTKPIEDIYKYLIIDGLWVKVYDGRLKDMVILFVLGVTLDNKKEIIAFKLAKGETEEEVTSLLNDIYRRGLEGKNLKLIASDGAKGIRAAINMVYPYAKWQLCYVHKLRNLIKHIRYKQRHRVMTPISQGVFKLELAL
jgi:transposase-like protein